MQQIFKTEFAKNKNKVLVEIIPKITLKLEIRHKHGNFI